MPKKEFSTGDEVRLKTGGPLIVVENIYEDGRIGCCWFEGKVFRREKFSKKLLKFATPVTIRAN